MAKKYLAKLCAGDNHNLVTVRRRKIQTPPSVSSRLSRYNLNNRFRNMSHTHFWLAVGLAVSASFALFEHVFGLGLASAAAEFWIMPKNDMTGMTAAYEAFLREPWDFPLAMVSRLLPEPVSIVFTDSIPWASIGLKASGVGSHFNQLGLFLLLSYPLQVLGMAALLRALGVRDVASLLIGCLLALVFPPWIARQFGHIALSGHWIILFALAAAVDAIRQGFGLRHAVWFCVLTAIACGVHPYHLVPIAACFGAALLAELVARGRKAVWHILGAALSVLATLALSAWTLGYTEGAGQSGGADALGFYSMNILGPFLPLGSAIFGHEWNGVWFSSELIGNDGQLFEGFQYLGTGIVAALIVMAGHLSLRARVHPPAPACLLRWGPLVVMMAILAGWAVGWTGYAGPWKVFDLPKPAGLVAEYLGHFRAHGRFFWAPGYLLTALVVVWATAFLPRKAMLSVLVVVLALQAYDTSPLRLGVREVFAAPERKAYPRALDTAESVAGRPWFFVPTYFCNPWPGDLLAVQQMVLMIVRRRGTTNTFPTARSKDGPCDKRADWIGEMAAHDDPRIVVAMNNGRMTGGALETVASRQDCYRFSRGAICGNGLKNIEGLQKAERGELSDTFYDQILSVRMDDGKKPRALRSGWSKPGKKGIWSDGSDASLMLDLPEFSTNAESILIDIRATAYSDSPSTPQRVVLEFNGRYVRELIVDHPFFRTYRVSVPVEGLRGDGRMSISFAFPDASTPRGDPRLLGIALQEIRVLAKNPAKWEPVKTYRRAVITR